MEIEMREPQDDGRIPFRLRIGVTGHRTLENEEQLAELVREQIDRALERLEAKKTDLALSVVSQLADGADRLVVREVMAAAEKRGDEARVECYLPMARDEYAQAQGFDPESKREFEDLLAKATVVREPAAGAGHSDRHEAYRSAGHLMVGRCDVLIALWDGLPSGGRGGTAEILAWAAARSKPCIWIETEDEHTVRDNLDPDRGHSFFGEVQERAQLEPPIRWSSMEHPTETLQSARTALRSLDEWNREPSPPGFQSRLDKERNRTDGLADWVAPPYARATTLAVRWRRRFEWTARVITTLAALGAVMLGVGLSYGEEAEIWAWAEAAMFFAALLGLLLVRRFAVHRRWITFRVLAEHLRSAHFLALAGADFRRQARLEPVYSGKQPTAWLMRAFEEVWDRRPLHPTPPSELDPDSLAKLKSQLTDGWIKGQIAYHEQNMKDHDRWHRIQGACVLLLFIGTIVFAVLHARHTLEHAPTLFTIVLPAIGASLGVLMTVNQHQALSERSASMKSDLTLVCQELGDAPAETLDRVSSDAAQVIAQETVAWFGTMWFNDIEHP
jgi:hypothetical protein